MDDITNAFVEWWETNRWGGERETNAAFEGFPSWMEAGNGIQRRQEVR